MKILFVEDNPDDLEVVRHELRGLSTVDNVFTRETLSAALKDHWDLILLDLRMPELDGHEALRMAKEIQPETPVVIVTGSVDDETASMACREGAVDYLRKDRLRRIRMSVTNAVENAERKKREARGQQSELIGQLSTGLAHDLNGMLGVIMAGSDILRKTAEGEEHRILDAMESSSRHGAEMLKQLLLFAAGEGGSFKVITPAYLLGKINSMLRGTFPSNIKLEIMTTPGTAPVKCSELEITKCILNLAINSRDALEHGGTIVISAQNATEPDGLFVQISVRDNGPGIPETVVPLIFSPFFSTKQKGTGLGLSMAKKIISDHHGKITVMTGPTGTEFRILLPAFDGDSDKKEQMQFDGGGCHALLVEDTEFLRTWTKLFLEESNYVVHEAASGPEAMSLFLKNRIDVLISDIWLPVMSGPQLAKALLELNKDLPLIFVTGLDATAEIIPKPAATIQKPFSKTLLLSELQRVLLAVRAD